MYNRDFASTVLDSTAVCTLEPPCILLQFLDIPTRSCRVPSCINSGSVNVRVLKNVLRSSKSSPGFWTADPKLGHTTGSIILNCESFFFLIKKTRSKIYFPSTSTSTKFSTAVSLSSMQQGHLKA